MPALSRGDSYEALGLRKLRLPLILRSVDTSSYDALILRSVDTYEALIPTKR